MKNNSGLALAVLIVGLANAFAFAWGVTLFVTTFAAKSFSTSVSTGDNRHAISLSGDRFSVVEGSRVTVFHVNGMGRVERLDDVDTQFRQLEPFMPVDNYYFDSPKTREQKRSEAIQTPAPQTTPAVR